ncbi:nad dependent [Stylonychia lemnae]|uniref:Nad dependent n=1 Tax=Stylonychia lemnae TaxID=5949 RepID=A0A078AXV3_STYLE|nr:nad dependent [Stylonychia lemnae]|eukprot:CDW87009.1 nad dependent [Stylonychia lemnae]
MEGQNQHVLVLGGSSFMGLELLITLSKRQNTLVYFINRGKKYWDGLSHTLTEQHPDRIFHYVGDRGKRLEFQQVLGKMFEDMKIKSGGASEQFDLVVDFSAYLKSDLKVYSTYESSQAHIDIGADEMRRLSHSVEKGGLTEDMGYLDQSKLTEKQLKQLKKQDSYGFKKLLAENYIFEQSQKLQFKVLSFRLPDVIGPFDESHRFWQQILWCQNSEKYPLQIDNNAKNIKISFVLSIDVVTIITYILDQKITPTGIYNIGCQEQLTLVEFYKLMCELLGCGEAKMIEITDKISKTIFPSVSLGPICIDQAKNMLKFSPTPLRDALKISIDFFTSLKEGQFEQERQDVLKGFQDIVKIYEKQNEDSQSSSQLSSSSTSSLDSSNSDDDESSINDQSKEIQNEKPLSHEISQ